MPLVSNTLVNELRKFMDEEYSSFDEFPQDKDKAIEAMANAIDAYASKIGPPASSSSASTAIEAMKTAMIGLNDADQAISKIQDGIVQYATILATGMSPPGKAPSGKPDIKSVEEIGLNGGSSSDVASAFATIVDVWFRTGTYTPPSSSPIPWA
jgi:hypothetical protein